MRRCIRPATAWSWVTTTIVVPPAFNSATGAALLDLLAELNAGGTTIVVVTHDQAVASRMHRRIEMLDGRIITDSTGPREGAR